MRDYKLHDKSDPLPQQLARARTNVHLDTRTGETRVCGLPLNAYRNPKLRGVVIVCDRCERWQETEPGSPEDMELGNVEWRAHSDFRKEVCTTSGQRKLTAGIVRTIRKSDISTVKKVDVLAGKYGLHRNSIYRLHRGETWESS